MSLQPCTDACDLTGTLKEQWPEAGHAAIGCFTDTIIDSSAMSGFLPRVNRRLSSFRYAGSRG
jgi:hypothetical protein